MTSTNPRRPWLRRLLPGLVFIISGSTLAQPFPDLSPAHSPQHAPNGEASTNTAQQAQIQPRDDDEGGRSDAAVSPEVTLRSVDVRSIDMRGATLAISLRVLNPNAEDLVVDVVYYMLKVAQVPPMRGRIVQPTLFPAGKTRDVTVPVQIPYDANLLALLGAVQNSVNQPLDYYIEGKIKVRDSLDLIPFDYAGQFTPPVSAGAVP